MGVFQYLRSNWLNNKLSLFLNSRKCLSYIFRHSQNKRKILSILNVEHYMNFVRQKVLEYVATKYHTHYIMSSDDIFSLFFICIVNILLVFDMFHFLIFACFMSVTFSKYGCFRQK